MTEHATSSTSRQHFFSSADTVAHYIGGEWVDVPLAKSGVVHFMGYLPLWMGGPYLSACAGDPSNLAIGEGELYDWDKVTCEDCKTINNPWPKGAHSESLLGHS